MNTSPNKEALLIIICFWMELQMIKIGLQFELHAHKRNMIKKY